MIKKKRLTLDEMKLIAREATRNALGDVKCPKLPKKNLALGMFPTDTECAFELYYCNEIPENGVVITSAVIDVFTGELLKMEVFLERLEEYISSLSEIDTSSQ